MDVTPIALTSHSYEASAARIFTFSKSVSLSMQIEEGKT